MTDHQQQKPIYVATYGRDPKMAEAVSEKLLPDIEGELCLCLSLTGLLMPLLPSLLSCLSLANFVRFPIILHLHVFNRLPFWQTKKEKNR